MAGMEVRTARDGDVRQIAEVHVRTWQGAYRDQVPDDFLDALSVDDSEVRWHVIVAGTNLPFTGTFVLEEDTGVVGFAHIAPSRDDDAPPGTGEVTSIYVLPEHWGRGGGRALMDGAVESLRAGGYSTATLWVLDTNWRARRFYEIAGWLPDGGTKSDDRGTFTLHEVRYARALP
jgi:ribosomal protein S18 acetylase RimI-like enzyme